jgi:hypothetical protein
MSDMNDQIKNLVSKVSKPIFSIPIADNPSYSYSNNYDANDNFTFGLRPESTLRSGLDVETMTNSKAEIYAAADGQLFFSPSGFPGKDTNVLHLSILPEIVMALRLGLPSEFLSPTYLVYIPVHRDKVKVALSKVLRAQGKSSTKVSSILEPFFTGEAGIPIKRGDYIGNAIGKKIRIEFWDANGYAIHPLYLLWRWNGLNMFTESSHTLIDALRLSQLRLSIENDNIINEHNNTKFNLGPCFFFPS